MGRLYPSFAYRDQPDYLVLVEDSFDMDYHLHSYASVDVDSSTKGSLVVHNR